MDSFQNPYMGLSGITPEEVNFLQIATAELNENQQKQFFTAYISKRKNPQDILLLTVIGFFGIAGIQRFALGQIAWGVFYLFTVGLFGICTIVDLINNKSLTLEYNKEIAYQSFRIATMNS